MTNPSPLSLPSSIASCTAEVVLLTRKGCCLCDTAKEELRRLKKRIPFELAEFDIDTFDIGGEPSLRELFNDEVPVIFIRGRKAFKYQLDSEGFVRKLAAGRRT